MGQAILYDIIILLKKIKNKWIILWYRKEPFKQKKAANTFNTTNLG